MTGSTDRPRWLVIVGAVLIQSCLGAVYAWSLFNAPLMEKFGWGRESVVLTFSIVIGVFALSTIPAGQLQDKFGPRIVAMVGGGVLGLGLALASRASSVVDLYLAYGVIGGIGIGTAYVTPIATCLKWYPDKRGFIAGISVVGMGLGGVVFKPVILALIEGVGVSQAFLILGLVYGSVIMIGAQFLSVPPPGFMPAGWRPPVESAIRPDLNSMQMLRTPHFWALWAIYVMGCTAGLMVIATAANIGTEYFGLSAKTAAYAVVLIAIANAGGRPSWGAISDRIGRSRALVAIYTLTAMSMFVLAFGPTHIAVFMTAMLMTGFGFGGFLALFPSISADFFGTRHVGMNYGLLYTAWGCAAFVGAFLRGLGDTQGSFIAAGFLSIVAGVVALSLRPPAAMRLPGVPRQDPSLITGGPP